MTSQRTIFRLEPVPGDKPRAIEQPNGDLLVPSELRDTIALALQHAELAVALSQRHNVTALTDLRRLLNVDRQPVEQKEPWKANLLRLSPI